MMEYLPYIFVHLLGWIFTTSASITSSGPLAPKWYWQIIVCLFVWPYILGVMWGEK